MKKETLKLVFAKYEKDVVGLKKHLFSEGIIPDISSRWDNILSFYESCNENGQDAMLYLLKEFSKSYQLREYFEELDVAQNRYLLLPLSECFRHDFHAESVEKKGFKYAGDIYKYLKKYGMVSFIERICISRPTGKGTYADNIMAEVVNMFVGKCISIESYIDYKDYKRK